jgi:hypothetical protein
LLQRRESELSQDANTKAFTKLRNPGAKTIIFIKKNARASDFRLRRREKFNENQNQERASDFVLACLF